ncbi:MAG: cytochrome c family protein [Proteobacteria bacterium]|nr:cytochrome c family protein [Pseudomonadota bacterium]
MLKKVVLTLMVIGFVFTSIGIGFAGEDGNSRKGKYTYRNVYKACSKRGEIDSPKPLLSPDSKTQAQWKRTFEKKDFDQFKCSEEWSKLSEKDLNDIYSYLYEHAADSPSPAKCK